MSFFDFVSEKVNELLGGGVEEVTNQIQDAGQQQVDEVIQQVDEVKSGILPGSEDSNQ